jgi:hypothetical protein
VHASNSHGRAGVRSGMAIGRYHKITKGGGVRQVTPKIKFRENGVLYRNTIWQVPPIASSM